jgi:hypothetical protein
LNAVSKWEDQGVEKTSPRLRNFWWRGKFFLVRERLGRDMTDKSGMGRDSDEVGRMEKRDWCRVQW